MSIATMTISDTDAAIWAALGALLAVLFGALLPELMEERARRAEGDERTLSSFDYGCALFVCVCAALAAVLAVKVLSPCTEGDAVLVGVGAMALFSGAMTTLKRLIPRDT